MGSAVGSPVPRSTKPHGNARWRGWWLAGAFYMIWPLFGAVVARAVDEWWRQAGTEVICHVRNLHAQDVRWFADIDLYTLDGG